jgi:dihydropyrimidinase
MYDLVIENGLLITPGGLVDAGVAVEDGRIAALGSGLAGRQRIDAQGCYVLPGGVDIHAHLHLKLANVESADTFGSASVAAACGGTTTVIDFVDPQPGQGMLDALSARRAQADPQVAIDYGLHMTIPAWHGAKESRLAELEEVMDAGVPTFKLYQAYEGYMLDDAALYRVMAQIADLEARVVLHSETGPLLEEFRREALADGLVEAIWHERTRPARLEATAIHRAAEIAHAAGAPLHIFHIGCTDAIGEVVNARLRGVFITGETCPQYLLLSADEHLDQPDGHRFLCAPPLRSPDHQEMLWTALAEGDLHVISTDHCSWRLADKEGKADFTQVPGGLPGVEARLALLHHFGVNEERLSLTRWVEVCCTNPAQIAGLQSKGSLLPGYDADLVIFDPEREQTLSAATLHGACDWTPYAGITLTGWPRDVLLRGEVIVQNGRYVGQPGQGRFVHRSFV